MFHMCTNLLVLDLHVLIWKDMLLSERSKLQNRMYRTKIIYFLNAYAYTAYTVYNSLCIEVNLRLCTLNC